MSYSEGCKTITGSPYWMAPVCVSRFKKEGVCWKRKRGESPHRVSYFMSLFFFRRWFNKDILNAQHTAGMQTHNTNKNNVLIIFLIHITICTEKRIFGVLALLSLKCNPPPFLAVSLFLCFMLMWCCVELLCFVVQSTTTEFYLWSGQQESLLGVI